MTVTASVLYDLVQCPQRVALDAFGDRAKRDEVSAFVRLLWERGTLFERENIAKLNQPLNAGMKSPSNELDPWQSRARRTLASSECRPRKE
jgi:hypothetical protein